MRWFCAIAMAFLWSGCSAEDSASTASQRRVGEARLQEDLTVSLTYGTVRGFTSTAAVLRSASPLAAITVEAGAGAEGPIAVELLNQHLDAELRVDSVAWLDVDDLASCPVVAGVDVDCVAVALSVGAACESSGQCADGLRCAMGVCAVTAQSALCEVPATARVRGRPTSMAFGLPIEPCTRLQLSTQLLTPSETLRFGVVGPSSSPDAIVELAQTFREEELDFVVLLGNQIANRSLEALVEYERAVGSLGTPAVVLAGPSELSVEDGQQFLRRFGPHDHRWVIKGARFFTLFSAEKTLGRRGLARLTDFLNALDDVEDGAFIALSHVPPFDPNALRNNSFRSDFEASQVMSLLEQNGVHQLYAGGLASGENAIHGVHTYVTTARGTLANPMREWLRVEVTLSSESETLRAGTQFIRVDRRR